MRFLVVGAGAIGGYFGGRLLQAGIDVTFLVRPRRASELTRDGLVIKSLHGDAHLPNPPIVLTQDIKKAAEVILLSCKAFDLDGAIASFAPAMGPQSAIIPLLNGMRHLDILDENFGEQHVLGGQCAISVTLNEQRHVVQLADVQSLRFGERGGVLSRRVESIQADLARGRFNSGVSENITQDMWEKWVQLATLASATCLMRANVGNILAAPGGHDLILGLRDECAMIATAAGYPPRAPFVEQITRILTAPGSRMTASMLRDILDHAPIEADQIVGDLVARAGAANLNIPLLRLAYMSLKTYEAGRVARSTG